MVKDLIQEAQQLYKGQNYLQALEVYESIRNQEPDVFEKNCKFNYMWSIFRGMLKGEESFDSEHVEKTRELVKYILDNLKNDQFLYQITVMRMLKHFKKKPNFEAEKINTWLDKLDPALLSDKSSSAERNGKIESYPSNKEEWYAVKTKALEKMECYEECMRVSQEALGCFQEFHYGNDIWFKRRIAISKSELGDPEGALEILKELLRVKQDWFIYQDISEIYRKTGALKAALSYSVDSMMKAGDDDKKVNVLWDMAGILEQMEQLNDGLAFKDYSVKLRIENGWKLSREIDTYYRTRQELIDGTSLHAIRRSVISTCERCKWDEKPLELGVVHRILGNGKSGFIKSDSGSYYFKFNEFKGRRSEIKEGLWVQFYAEKSFDIKKNCDSLCAVNIKPK